MSAAPYDFNFAPMKAFAKDILSPIKQSLFLLTKLPAAWFMGFRVTKLTAEVCEVTQPYSWFSKNPFNSVYFAAQTAAAEFSTGIPLMMALKGRENISLLVVSVSGEFHKKADKKIIFRCTDLPYIFEKVQAAIDTGEAQTLTLNSEGTMLDGTVVSKMTLVWSIKKRKK
jgi:hypothetical protein